MSHRISSCRRPLWLVAAVGFVLALSAMSSSGCTMPPGPTAAGPVPGETTSAAAPIAVGQRVAGTVPVGATYVYRLTPSAARVDWSVDTASQLSVLVVDSAGTELDGYHPHDTTPKAVLPTRTTVGGTLWGPGLPAANPVYVVLRAQPGVTDAVDFDFTTRQIK